MGVYIKGMKKPKDCNACFLDLYDRQTYCRNGEKALCPLIEVKVSHERDEFAKDANIRSKDCETCNHYKLTCDLFSEICKYEPKDKPQTETSTKSRKVQLTKCRNSEYYETCEYTDKCNPTVCFKALDELMDRARMKGADDETD